MIQVLDNALSHELYYELIQFAQEPLFVVQGGRIVLANNAGAALLGYAVDELQGLMIDNLVALDDVELILKRYLSRMESSIEVTTYDIRLIHKSGFRIPSQLRLQRLAALSHPDAYDLPPPFVLGSITVVNSTDCDVQHKCEDYEKILNALPDMFYRTDAQGNFTYVSAACEEILGCASEALLGNNIRQLYISDKQGDKDEEKLRESAGKVIRIEKLWKNTQGNEIWVSSRSRAIIEQGQFAGSEGVVRNITHRKQEEERLLYLAQHDSLTGLLNRKGLNRQLDRITARAVRSHDKCAVLYMDVDNFKQVNDCYGHSIGDRLLSELATRLRKGFRRSDVISRVGGDEFIVVLDPIASEQDVQSAIHNFELLLNQSIQINTLTLKTHISIGYAIFPDQGIDASELIGLADQQMYINKANRRSH